MGETPYSFVKACNYIESVCNEFRELYNNIHGSTPLCIKRVAVLNSWGKSRSWGCHMVHHALYQKQNYSYAGVIESLSGTPFDVQFLSFDDIKKDKKLLEQFDVIINVGDGDTAHTGGAVWEDAEISSAIRQFVYEGGGFIGIGEPSGHQYQGHYFQLAGILGVEKETGFTLNYDKYNWEEHPQHFILADTTRPVDFGEGKKIFMPMKIRKSWFKEKRKCRWLSIISAGAVPSISAVFPTALKTAVFCTEVFSGALAVRIS